jgi:hypothetical protein
LRRKKYLDMDAIDIKMSYFKTLSKLLSTSLDEVQGKIKQLNQSIQEAEKTTNTKIDKEWVRVNVGGQLFTTKKSTLNPSNLFASMFEGKIEPDVDSNGVIYIDRDPKNFLAVLEYLRDKSLGKQVDLEQLDLEAKSFQINSLLKQIEIERVDRQNSVGKFFKQFFYGPCDVKSCMCVLHQRKENFQRFFLSFFY